MSQTIRLSLLAGAATAFGAVGTVSAETPSTASNDEVRAIVAEMLSDAETRTSLLQSGAMAGHDGRFFLSDGSGNFRLNVGGYAQFRYYLNFRDDGDGNNDGVTEDDFESGFQTRNTKIIFDGNVINPNIFYKIQGAFSRAGGGGGGDFRLEDAYVGYQWDNGFWTRWGQFKLPFLHEELVSATKQLAADRSLTNEVYNQDRSQGIELGYQADAWKAMFAFSDGFGSRNSEVGSTNPLTLAPGADGLFGTADDVLTPAFGIANVGGGGNGENDYSFTGRAEFKFAGDWKQYEDFTSMSGSEFFAVLGVAGHYEGSEDDRGVNPGVDGIAGTADDVTADSEFYGWTGDIAFEGDGWNFYAAGLGVYTDSDISVGGGGGSGNLDSDDYGLVVQGGIFIPDTDWEFFARYDVIFPDDDRGGTSNDDFSTVTAGVNWYWSGHAAKFTLDVQYFIDETTTVTTPNTGIGYFGDDDEGEVTIRAQFQLMF